MLGSLVFLMIGVNNVFHINYHHECFLRVDGHRLIVGVHNVRDPGVYFPRKLNWSFHCTVVVKKGMIVANCILRPFNYNCVSHFSTAFVCYCQPILGYGSQVWSPILQLTSRVLIVSRGTLLEWHSESAFWGLIPADMRVVCIFFFKGP